MTATHGVPDLELCFADPDHPGIAEELELRRRVLAEPLGLQLADVRFAFEPQSLRRWARAPGRLVGCVLFHREGESGRLYQMAVEPTLHRHGVGRALVERLHDELRASGVRTVWLNARGPVVGFYERLGYAAEGAPFVEIGIEHRRMTRTL